DTNLPRQSDKQLAESVRLYQTGQVDDALTMLAESIMEDPVNIRLPLTLSKLLVNEGRFADAEQLLSSMPPEQRREQSITNFQAQIEFIQTASNAPAIPDLESRLQQKPDDCEARQQLACLQLANDDYEHALEHFMTLMQTDRTFNNDAGRRGLLVIFSILGNDHDLVKKYREQLVESLH
ncbi:MAG: tetratricopeptide repeat protein, partial [Gammaproteobacteria bacterium]